MLQTLSYYSQTKFSFGKYEGKTVDEILNEDSQYIYYCINNLFHFALELSLLSTNKELENEKYFIALKRNYIKNLISGLYIPDKPTLENNYDGQEISRSMEGDWGGLYGEEASTGYWNTH